MTRDLINEILESVGLEQPVPEAPKKPHLAHESEEPARKDINRLPADRQTNACERQSADTSK